MKTKTIAMIMAMTMILVSLISGTLAWLTAKSDDLNNVFTTADIGVTLTETPNAKSDESKEENDIWKAEMIPGYSYTKDPVVKVTEGSVDCYLFVKFEEPTNVEDVLEYTSNLDGNGWTKLTDVSGVDNVWYREVLADATDREWHLLKDDTVKISENLTKTNMPTSNLELKYTAYATQLYKDAATKFTPAEAWAKIGK